MPRDVIMPALGMAQDKGLIVAWLKQAGDAVAEGDPLFEVETDKATMEVEAQGAGFLTNVRAGEGDEVPVGDVIATISETAEDTAPEAPEPPAEESADEAPTPEGRAVIMPALGMAQDTGKIVDWIVAPGDAVSEGDPLFEVETDKATMEVAAECDGFIAAVYAEAGDDVPVGDTIAIISAEKPDAPVASKAKVKAAAPAEPVAKAAAAPKIAPQKAVSASGRILASPKVKRLAAERGIDLARLVEAGVDQPFHVSDLDRPEATAAPAAPQAASLLRVAARAPSDALDALLAWVDGEGSDRPAIMAAMASGAMRAATAADHVGIEMRPSGDRHDDADLARATGPDDAPPALILRDLTASRVTSVETGTDAVPCLTLSRDGADIVIRLAADPSAMGEETATALVAGLADRIADPMRQLF